MSLLAVFGSVLQAIGGVKITRRFAWTGYSKKEKKMPPEYRYFKPEEVVGLDPEFVAKLDQARHIAGFPFIITSGFRTPEKNQSIPGSIPNSAHLKGLAVDLKVENSHEVSLICDSAKAVGITRRIVYVDVDKDFQPVHVHIDVDPEKVNDVSQSRSYRYCSGIKWTIQLSSLDI